MAQNAHAAIAGAEGGTRLPRIPKGVHTLELTRISERISKNPKSKGDTVFAFEFKTVGSSNATEAPEGAAFSYLQMSSWMGHEGRIKAVLQALSGEVKISADDVTEAFSEDSPLIGRRCKCVGQDGDKEGFLTYSWAPVAEAA